MTALLRELGPAGLLLWCASMALVCGLAVQAIYEHGAGAERPPPATAEWQCGLDVRDYAAGGCADQTAVTFCVGRGCP